MKKSSVALLVVLTMFLSMITVSGQESTGFKDVAENHWARHDIELMAKKGIINGYEGRFRPEDTVARDEFAKMLVKTLGLEEKVPSTPYFDDVKKSDWAYTYVETARNYLTGFTSSTGYRFKPDEPSVREDMAVAVIKGLYDKGQVSDPNKTDISILDRYSDETSISTNLRKYVAAAINEGLMVGSNGEFDPMGHLSRAEAATLLARLIDDEEKVVFDGDNKVVISDTTTSDAISNQKPSLEKTVGNQGVVLDWSQVGASGFKYYKVVLSKSDSTPSYSENGYAIAISDVSNTRVELKSGMAYNGGDLGGVIKGGETYYVAITAVYEDGKETSNVVSVTIPGSYTEASDESRTPVLTYSMGTSGVELKWSQVPEDGFSYYKVVLSQTKEKPYYPDYGYLTYISDPSITTYTVQEGKGYNDGSKGGIGGEVEDESYYMTITAVYSNGKYTSNAVFVTVADQ